MKPEIKSFSRYEELQRPSKTAQGLLSRHLGRSREILHVELTQEEEQTSGKALESLLFDAKGSFLLDRLIGVGVSTLVDLQHVAGLATLWEYRDLLRIGMGLFLHGRNWAFMGIVLARLRTQEELTLGNVSTPAILKQGMYRDKYRALYDTLWKPVKPKKREMVDLDSDDEGATTREKVEVVPREVLRIRAVNMLKLTRFR